MKKQYIVKCKSDIERETLYQYLISKGYTPLDQFKHQDFLSSHFPFVIEPNKKFWICESITCCAVAATNGVMISLDEYFENMHVANHLMTRQKKLL